MSVFQVAPADVLEAQCWAAYWAMSCGQLAVQGILWYATILPSVPAIAVYADIEGGVCSGSLLAPVWRGVGDIVLPCDAGRFVLGREVENSLDNGSPA